MLLSLMAAAAHPVAQRSTHDVVYAAIIAASAAIVGGIIGGSIPGYFMLKAEDKRHAHERELADQARHEERGRERRAVVGTARALNEFFERLPSILTIALEGQHWWADDLERTIQPPSLDDQKAVLGQLTSEEAWVISTSMRALELLRTQRALAIETSGPLAPIDGDMIDRLERGRTIAQDASRCLRRMAELPVPPPEP